MASAETIQAHPKTPSESAKLIPVPACAVETQEKKEDPNQSNSDRLDSAFDEKQSAFKNLGILDRFLVIWIFLAMAIGIILGNFVPGTGRALQKGKFVGVSIPIAIGLLVMMYPILCKVRYESLHHMFRTRQIWIQIAFSMFVNWIIAPFFMLALAWAFLPDKPELRQGLTLVGLARCIAMVLTWTGLAGGDTEYCAILVAINSFLQMVLFAPMGVFFIQVISDGCVAGADSCGEDDSSFSANFDYSTAAKSVAVFLGIPLAAAILTRYLLRGAWISWSFWPTPPTTPPLPPFPPTTTPPPPPFPPTLTTPTTHSTPPTTTTTIPTSPTTTGATADVPYERDEERASQSRCSNHASQTKQSEWHEWYDTTFLPTLSPLSLLGLLFTILVLFASQGAQIVHHQIVSVLRVAAPLVVYFATIFSATLFVTYRLLGFGYGLATAQSFTAASNNFELAIAVAVATFGPDSDQALAATVGPLVEVPVLVGLVYAVKWMAGRWRWRG
ncbi:arsenical-resistance protein [Xylona heveae TC161]|uniref:Arsenical-resistance protein n=1 Tax=Xylona heveae (strain CBS 132557 / TC161) TaxID=1328760 RepID=A0A165FCQ5_XYLHT|nr:arsenical-resistance protein [Xylona heveae TC161]KZF20829.1 arsenical-resistance protein [Xylona heveae TC161]